MGEGARIGHLNVAIHLELIQMDKNCTISQRNWVTGFPLNDESHFQDFPDSYPSEYKTDLKNLQFVY